MNAVNLSTIIAAKREDDLLMQTGWKWPTESKREFMNLAESKLLQIAGTLTDLQKPTTLSVLVLEYFESSCLKGFLFLTANEKRTKTSAVSGEREYSGYKNQIFVSGLLPSCKCPPFGGLTVCVPLYQQDKPSESKGEKEKEVVETQCGLKIHTRLPVTDSSEIPPVYIRCHACGEHKG